MTTKIYFEQKKTEEKKKLNTKNASEIHLDLFFYIYIVYFIYFIRKRYTPYFIYYFMY